MKNKKGDLPVTILVIGVFAVCIFALLMFYLNDLKSRDNLLAGLDKIQEANLKAEKTPFFEIKIETDALGEYVKEDLWTDYWADENKLLFEVKRYLPK